MPYIERDRRAELLDNPLDAKTPGELNFLVTMLVQGYIFRDTSTPGYTRFNEAIGVLECAKLELYRRQVAPYEDTKVVANGDVY